MLGNLDFESYITVPFLFSALIHVIGALFLYHNRRELLYDDDDNDPNTPTTLSLGRCWSWAMFYFACSYWVRYLTGNIPITTPFPPGLEEMLFACLAYEFLKRGVDLGELWVSTKSRCRDRRSRKDEDGEDD